MKKWIILSICLLLFMTFGRTFIINKMAFFPEKTNGVLSADQLPEGVIEQEIPTLDGLKISSLYIKNASSKDLVIYFHGNAGNIYSRIDDLKVLSSLGVNVLGVSYRGYGKSQGTPAEKGIYLDGKSALQFAHKTLGFSDKYIFIMGRSIGTTVAINTAMNQNIAGVILVSPLTNGKEMAKLGPLKWLSFLTGEIFNNIEKANQIKAPTLVIHGTADPVIPFSMGEEIFNKITTQKSFLKLTNAGHNNLSSPQYASVYWGAIATFLKENDTKTNPEK